MKDEELDRLLAGTPLPDPGPAFTWAVMAQVRREAAVPPPIPFPWRRLAVGLSLCIVLVVAGIAALAPAAGAEVPATAVPLSLLGAAWARPALLATAVLFVTWLSLRVTAIFSGARA
ncbi:MAG: hypothetical protein MUC67_10615 [Acidobacteria bacterium]|jgi:hypothetical protein|nr:hypothetical protein [Acidobacteriota bacterium]